MSGKGNGFFQKITGKNEKGQKLPVSRLRKTPRGSRRSERGPPPLLK